MLKAALLTAIMVAAPVAADAEVREYRVLAGGNDVGHLKADVTDQRVVIDYQFMTNGRGPRLAETIELDGSGIPVRWDIEGVTRPGNRVDETFVRQGGTATWRDATGDGRAEAARDRFYVPQNGTPMR